MKGTVAAPTFEASQRQAEDWWLKQNGFRKLREIKRSPRDSAPSLTKPEQYLVSIVYGRNYQATAMPSPVGLDWSAKLMPSLTLKGGDKLATLGDARYTQIDQESRSVRPVPRPIYGLRSSYCLRNQPRSLDHGRCHRRSAIAHDHPISRASHVRVAPIRAFPKRGVACWCFPGTCRCHLTKYLARMDVVQHDVAPSHSWQADPHRSPDHGHQSVTGIALGENYSTTLDPPPGDIGAELLDHLRRRSWRRMRQARPSAAS